MTEHEEFVRHDTYHLRDGRIATQDVVIHIS